MENETGAEREGKDKARRTRKTKERRYGEIISNKQVAVSWDQPPCYLHQPLTLLVLHFRFDIWHVAFGILLFAFCILRFAFSHSGIRILLFAFCNSH